jgi:hypothetical protein
MPKGDPVLRVNQSAQLEARSYVSPAGAVVPVTSANADTVDYLHGSITPVPGRLLALDSNAQFPAAAIPGYHEPVSLAGDSAPELALVGQELRLAEVLTPTEHTAIGNAHPHHAPVTAGHGVVVAGQEVGVDLAESFVWSGVHQFRESITTHAIVPEAPDTYDIGLAERPYRRGYISEFWGMRFVEETAALVGGRLVVPHNQGTLAADVADTDTQVDFGRPMDSGDVVLFRAPGAVEYMQIGSLVDGTTYNVSRDLDGSGANAWPAGTVFAVLGVDGDGRIEMTADVSPRISVFVQGPGGYNDQKEVVRLADLSDWQSAGLSGYGGAIGDYASGNYLVYAPDDGFRLKAGGGLITIDHFGISSAVRDGQAYIGAYKFVDADNRILSSYKAELSVGQQSEHLTATLEVPPTAPVPRESTLILAAKGTQAGSHVIILAGNTRADFYDDYADRQNGIFLRGHGVAVGSLAFTPVSGDLPEGRLFTQSNTYVGGGLYVGGTSVNPAAGEIHTTSDIRVGGGLYVGGTSVNPAAGEIHTTSDIRVGGGLYVGSTSVNPAAGEIHTTSDIRVGGGLYVGGTSVNPAAGEIHTTSDIRVGGGLYVGGTGVNPATGVIGLPEISTPATPPANSLWLYAKGGRPHALNSAGQETPLSSFVPLNPMRKIVEATALSAGTHDYVLTSYGVPSGATAVAVLIGGRWASANNGYYMQARAYGGGTGDFYAGLSSLVANINAFATGIVPVSSNRLRIYVGGANMAVAYVYLTGYIV